MCSHCIIRHGSALFAKLKIRFAHFEEDFYIPAFAIGLDDFFFGQINICRNQNQIILSVVPVSNKDQFYGNSLVSFNSIRFQGKKIRGSATALLGCSENGRCTLHSSIVAKMNFVTFLDYANDIVANIFDL